MDVDRVTPGLRAGDSASEHLSPRERSAAPRPGEGQIELTPSADPHPPAAARPPSPGGRGSGHTPCATHLFGPLAAQQRLLARLLTDEALRARWAADPRAVEAELGLAGAASPEPSAPWRRQVEQFARALVFKRRREVEKLLPLTRRALGATAFGALFRRHASAYVPSGLKKHRDDALAFGAFLEGPARAELPGAWTTDLIRYEAAALATAGMPRHVTLRAFRHDVRELAAWVLHGDRPSLPDPRPMLVLWWRPGASWTRRTVILASPFHLQSRRD